MNKEEEEYEEFLIVEKHNLKDIGLLSAAVDSEDVWDIHALQYYGKL